MKLRTSRAIKRFEEAVREHAFKGARMPDEHEALELEYRDAKEHLFRCINEEEKK